MELFNYAQHCRLCLKARNAGNPSKNIFSHTVEGCEEPLVQIIYSLFNIELQSHKAYPQFVCRKCLTEVENILLFKEDLLCNQEFLLGLFRAAYPNYVEKKTSDSRKIFASNYSAPIDPTSSNDAGRLRLQEGLTKAQGTPDNDASNEDHSKIKNVQAAASILDYNDHYAGKNQHLKTDKNRKNVPSEHLPDIQPIEIRHIDIDENKLNLDNASFPKKMSSDDVNSAESDLMASFLQNLNLVSLQNAEILKARQEPLRRTRKLHSKKLKALSTVPDNIPNIRNIHKGTIKHRSPTIASSGTSPDLLTRRSINFLSRYSCRSLNHTYLKRGKVTRKPDIGVLSPDQRKKTANKINPSPIVPPKRRGSSLGPKILVKSGVASKKKGCDIRSNLDNNDTSTSDVKMETEDSAYDNVQIENALKDSKATKKPRINMKDSHKTTQNMHASNKDKEVCKEIEDNRLTGIKSELSSPTISTRRYQATQKSEPILPECFHRHSKPAVQIQKTASENSIFNRRSIYTRGLGNKRQLQQGKESNHSDGEENYNNGLKIRLYRSPSLNGQSSFDSETDKNIWSIGDYSASTSPRECDFRRKLSIQVERSPNALRKLPESSILENSNPLNKRIKSQNSLYKSPIMLENVNESENPGQPTRLGKTKAPDESDSTSQFKNDICRTPGFTEILPTPRRKWNQPEESQSLADDTKEGLDFTLHYIDSLTSAEVAPKRPRGRPRKSTMELYNGTKEVKKPIRQTRPQNIPTSPNKVNKSDETLHVMKAKKDSQFNLAKVESTSRLSISSYNLNNTKNCIDDLTLSQKIKFKELKQELLTEASYSEDFVDNVSSSQILKVKDIKQDYPAEEIAEAADAESRSFKNFDNLKYDTQEVDYGLPEVTSLPTLNHNHSDNELLIENKLVGKVRNINVAEDEFQFSLTKAAMRVNTVPEDLDSIELSQYPRPRTSLPFIKSEDEIKCEQMLKRSRTNEFLNRPRLRERKCDVSSRCSVTSKSSSENNLIENKVGTDLPPYLLNSATPSKCSSLEIRKNPSNITDRKLRNFDKKQLKPMSSNHTSLEPDCLQAIVKKRRGRPPKLPNMK